MSKKDFLKNFTAGVYIRMDMTLESNSQSVEDVDIDLDLLHIIEQAIRFQIDGHLARRSIMKECSDLIDVEVVSSYQVTNVKCLNGGEVVSDFL